ncbi:uncharacterized protein [Porites lutea]|uniref:uncharacterized protein n=1 Tax=Porites lutea TaxID=51062 RepID=UPI003CC6C345
MFADINTIDDIRINIQKEGLKERWLSSVFWLCGAGAQLTIIVVTGANITSNFTGLDVNIDPTSLKTYEDEVEATCGELNLGMNYFEGDILLTQQQKDLINASKNASNIQARDLVRDTSKLWIDAVVPYLLADDLNLESRGYIDSAISEWSGKTCLQFREKTYDDEDYIEFVYEVGCSSYVGRIGGRQTISVGNADGSIICRHGNIVHEIAHSVGFFHEHSRPDRDDYVNVHWDNVESGYEKNFHKETLDTVDSRDVGYDYDSVMHYGEFFFTREPGLRTLEPLDPSASIGQRIGLSEKDVEQGNLLYDCTDYYDDDVKPQNKTGQGSSPKKVWYRPLRDHEIKVLRKSKVLKQSHKPYSSEHFSHKGNRSSSSKKDSLVHKTKRKGSLLHTIVKGTKKTKKFTSSVKSEPSDAKIKQEQAKSRSELLTEKQIQPELKKVYSGDDADILEGDDEEDDDVFYSRGVSSPAVAPETPNQLATDRATLAQEEEDAVQQQDNDDIGEENLGKNFFEGDMMLTPEQESFLDNIKNKVDTQEGAKRALIKDKMYLWPKAKVYYDFHKGVDRIGRRRARAAMRHWQKHTCLKFKRVRNSPDNFGYIKFVFEGGCASRVGRGGDKEQKLTIGSPALRCKVGNIIHELGHAIGFFHEHSRPDRNTYVRVLKKNILPGYERNFYRFGRKWIDSKDVPYDYGSIMHYNRAFFSRFPVMLDTIIPLKRNAEIGQRKALSRFDILQANLLYQCDGRKKLSDEEIQELKEESESDINDQASEVFCADVYDSDSCNSIKNLGYCQKFPNSMRTTCGITCNLCGTNRHQPRGLKRQAKRKSLVNKLKSTPAFNGDTALKRTLLPTTHR